MFSDTTRLLRRHLQGTPHTSVDRVTLEYARWTHGSDGALCLRGGAQLLRLIEHGLAQVTPARRKGSFRPHRCRAPRRPLGNTGGEAPASPQLIGSRLMPFLAVARRHLALVQPHGLADFCLRARSDPRAVSGICAPWRKREAPPATQPYAVVQPRYHRQFSLHRGRSLPARRRGQASLAPLYLLRRLATMFSSPMAPPCRKDFAALTSSCSERSNRAKTTSFCSISGGRCPEL